MFFTLPLKMLPVWQTIEGSFPSLQTGVGSALLRFAMVCVSTTIALLVPDFTFLCSLVGALCLGVVGLVLPPLMALKAPGILGPPGRTTLPLVVLNVLLLALGVLAVAFCTVMVVMTKVKVPVVLYVAGGGGT
jgi:hypothetical protein